MSSAAALCCDHCIDVSQATHMAVVPSHEHLLASSDPLFTLCAYHWTVACIEI